MEEKTPEAQAQDGEQVAESSTAEKELVLPLPTLEELLQAGVQWGHHRKKLNPRMREYIFKIHNRICIIDLGKTLDSLYRAEQFLYTLASQGKKILFVGTKRQAKEVVEAAARSVGMPYVTHRWLGGMLTNFITIRRSVMKLEEIYSIINDPSTYFKLTKKERLKLEREKEKMERVLGGIMKMDRLPAALYVVDVIEEDIAVHEANILGIPVVGIVDTNADPTPITYPIPCNDDSTNSIAVITRYVTEAIRQGVEEYRKSRPAVKPITVRLRGRRELRRTRRRGSRFRGRNF